MQEETKLSHEIIAFFTKSGSWIFSVLFGLFGKVGMEIMMKKKYTWIQWAGVILVSMFFGYIGGLASLHWKLEPYKMSMTVSLMTIFGQNIAFYVVYNYKRIGDNLIDVFTRKKS
jgi:hypothetical protein